jgi:wobble nucleotide-excising tRNase
MVCNALISWAHDGSHRTGDGLHMPGFGGGSVEMFRKVFKQIFDVTGHIAHYNMMMTQEVAVALPA